MGKFRSIVESPTRRNDMTNATHTPGPWFTHREGFSTVYIEARIGGGMIQEVAACGPTAEGPQQQTANANLIAEAPNMLAMLKRAATPEVLAKSFKAELDALIAKIEGAA